MRHPFAPLSDESRRKLRKRKHPDWVHPMLATLTDEPFSDEGWIYEAKLDGVRCLAFRDGSRIRLLSRNRKTQNAYYPELVDAFAAQETRDFVVDGEVVAFHGRVTSFSRLQRRMRVADPSPALRASVPVYYYAFDIVHLAGHDTTRLGLLDRKGLLQEALAFGDPLRFSSHRYTEGEAFLAEACRKGWEGLIAKRADSAYVERRSRDWFKFKCVARQEFVIGGWTDPQGARVGLGALLVGVYEDGELRYAGKVGTGYDEATLRDLGRRLAAIERKTSPFADRDGLPRKGVHWARPSLVADVGFTEWTSDGRLRHPRFLGLRRDKNPKAVVRERPQ
ncbi:MAG: non-homologous end-joining DNA ligase [Gemmatimonadota bacterium]